MTKLESVTIGSLEESIKSANDIVEKRMAEAKADGDDDAYHGYDLLRRFHPEWARWIKEGPRSADGVASGLAFAMTNLILETIVNGVKDPENRESAAVDLLAHITEGVKEALETLEQQDFAMGFRRNDA